MPNKRTSAQSKPPANGAADPKAIRNLDAERAVIGVSLLFGEQFPRARAILSGKHDFTEPLYQDIYAAMETLLRSRTAIDPITVNERMVDSARLRDAGGIGYLSQLMNGETRATHIEDHARIVRAKAAQRSLRDVFANAQEWCASEDMTPAQIAAATSKAIAAIAGETVAGLDLNNCRTEKQIADGITNAPPYVIQDIAPANAITMLFGEEKGGKSMLAFYLGRCVANGVRAFGKYATQKHPVLYLDLENNDLDIANFRSLFARVGSELIHYRTRGDGVPALDSPALIELCRKHEPLIIVDSLTKFAGKGVDQFNPGDMSEVLDKMLDLCAAGATVLLIHHAKKADAEKYANSYAIGAGVNTAFAVVSEDRPKLNRVRLEVILSRGAAPANIHLIGFPVISDTGHFGLSDFAESPVDNLVRWVSDQIAAGITVTRATIKARPGKRASENNKDLDRAISQGRLFCPGRGQNVTLEIKDLFRSQNGNEAKQDTPFPNTERTGTEDGDTTINDSEDTDLERSHFGNETE